MMARSGAIQPLDQSTRPALELNPRPESSKGLGPDRTPRLPLKVEGKLMSHYTK